MLVDACGNFSLEPLGAILGDSTVQKILHDAQQDLTILRRATGASPRNIFDTRTAAGFCGLVATVSLQDLMSSLLHIDLAKTETRTDWLRRPLTQRQVEYALDDVRHLVQARDELVRRAEELGNGKWLLEEMEQYDDAQLYEEREPRLQYERVKGCGKLRGKKLAALRELAAWRELEARQRDIPREHVLPDTALLAICQNSPSASGELQQIHGLSSTAVTRYSQQLLDCVAAGNAVPRRECPRIGPRHRRANVRTLVDRALTHIRQRCAEQRIDAQLVVSRAELTALAHDPEAQPPESRLIRGWRREFVGEEVSALLTRRRGERDRADRQ